MPDLKIPFLRHCKYISAMAIEERGFGISYLNPFRLVPEHAGRQYSAVIIHRPFQPRPKRTLVQKLAFCAFLSLTNCLEKLWIRLEEADDNTAPDCRLF